jgi:hypothetical protein
MGGGLYPILMSMMMSHTVGKVHVPNAGKGAWKRALMKRPHGYCLIHTFSKCIAENERCTRVEISLLYIVEASRVRRHYKLFNSASKKQKQKKVTISIYATQDNCPNLPPQSHSLHWDHAAYWE